MYVWILVVVSAVALQAQGLKTFGIGLSFQWLYPNEVKPEGAGCLFTEMEVMTLL
jgi:hypothetical protein